MSKRYKNEDELREEELLRIEPFRKKGLLDLRELAKKRVNNKTVILIRR